MTTERSLSGLIGASIRRVEDPVLVSGKGCYVDDIQLPGMLYLAFHRTTYPHAKILSIKTDAARAMAGVQAVLTGADIEGLNIPVAPVVSGQKIPPHPVLARGAVHENGVAVAAAVAQNRALAQDAASAIEVEYEALPSVTNAEKALEPGAPLAREELDSNICYIATKKGGDVDKAFAEADHICRMHIASPRQVALAIEPRGIVAKPEPIGDLTVWLSTQAPHRVRAELATALGFPEHKIRLIAPDVGGGFGSKGPLYREYVLACHLALKLGRPIKWIATRSEDFVTTIQGRDQAMTSETGAQARRHDARFEGPRRRQPRRLSLLQHRGPAAADDGHGARGLSNPELPRRGRRGLHQHVPYRTVSRRRQAGVGAEHRALGRQSGAGVGIGPSGNPAQKFHPARTISLPLRRRRRVRFRRLRQIAQREALHLSDYEKLMRERDAARARGELVGVGVSTFVEPSGGAGFESGTVRVERTGEITVLTGSSSHGQGHETSYAQVIADKMRVSMDHVAIRHGDTLAVQQGVGTFGSRSVVVGGGALALAAERVIEKARASPLTCSKPRRKTWYRRTADSPSPASPIRMLAGARSRLRRMAADFRQGWNRDFKKRSSSIPSAKPGALARMWQWCESTAKPASRPLKSSCW